MHRQQRLMSPNNPSSLSSRFGVAALAEQVHLELQKTRLHGSRADSQQTTAHKTNRLTTLRLHA